MPEETSNPDTRQEKKDNIKENLTKLNKLRKDVIGIATLPVKKSLELIDPDKIEKIKKAGELLEEGSKQAVKQTFPGGVETFKKIRERIQHGETSPQQEIPPSTTDWNPDEIPWQNLESKTPFNKAVQPPFAHLDEKQSFPVKIDFQFADGDNTGENFESVKLEYYEKNMGKIGHNIASFTRTEDGHYHFKERTSFPDGSGMGTVENKHGSSPHMYTLEKVLNKIENIINPGQEPDGYPQSLQGDVTITVNGKTLDQGKNLEFMHNIRGVNGIQDHKTEFKENGSGISPSTGEDMKKAVEKTMEQIFKAPG